jgi:hypothetical protein
MKPETVSIIRQGQHEISFLALESNIEAATPANGLADSIPER